MTTDGQLQLHTRLGGQLCPKESFSQSFAQWPNSALYIRLDSVYMRGTFVRDRILDGDPAASPRFVVNTPNIGKFFPFVTMRPDNANLSSTAKGATCRG